MGQGVTHCAVDLRHAAQGVGVLYAVAVEVRLAQPAALEHFAQIGSSLELTGVGTSLMDTFVKGHIGATESVKRECSDYVGGIGKDLRG